MIRLQYKHLLLLKLIREFTAKHQRAPLYREVYDNKTKGGLFNDYLRDNSIGGKYTKPINGNEQLVAVVRALKDAGLLTDVEGIRINAAGIKYVGKLSPNWQGIPLAVDIMEVKHVSK